ncbi:DUF1192 domain-containing protein [Nitratireductor aquimarinus]|uniref:DUF1192 domain-containing protein n=1 Tax=Alphaproteobacteria TaxID=28211 RepID=UPI000DDD0204|nr:MULTISPECIES: DUF1192 domain-containing protein [Alphaproteobacteria]MBY6021940.1 DUF1192 domain-containing protein [Nitratireductor sp. DP7N14-4]MBN7757153.1 DUF1192 domain-containing protein [Nitratireductor aquimarinus]MBN7761095.1 DUF1192 domain-containing protein [Nitratireductor aquibiodomus]MBN8244873.1 DUF1192 domain-containing protein [Nitratireductor aquimarinus]MBY5999913.1 DUF1192 domain-containing protein [Tritonibacter mobilis]
MGIFDEDDKKQAAGHRIGEDLSLLSVEELNKRIAQLKEEIVRLERDIESKGATKNAAEALFRRD